MNATRRSALRDDDYDFEDAPPRRRSSGLIVRTIDACLRNPVMAAGALVSGLAIIVIVTNALANQPMRHPSPLFNTRQTANAGVVSVATTPITLAQTTLQPLADVPAQAAAPSAPGPQTRPAGVDPDLVAATTQPAAAQPAANPSAATVPPLANLTAQLTERIQQALRDRGFYTGAVDGIAGPATSDAIRAFEQRLGVAATGDVNDRVLALLKSERGRQISSRPQVTVAPQAPRPIPVSAPVAPLAPKPALQLMPAPVPPEPLTGSTEGRLQRVQRALNIAGYGMLRTDGRYDDKTAEAIRKFQAEHGMPVTGQLSERLLTALAPKSAEAR